MSKRKVLIPLDGSEFSRQILPAARDWFNPETVALVLLRVDVLPTLLPNPAMSHRFVGDTTFGSLYAAYSEGMSESQSITAQERKSILGALQKELQMEADRLRALGYTVSTEVHFGEPAQTIMNLVTTAEIDLIAMTTHGRSGLARLAMGSVAEQVLRGVNVPVLLLRPAQAPVEAQPSAGTLLAQSLNNAHIASIAVATDGSRFGQNAVNWAISIAQQFKAELTVLVTANDHDSSEHNQQVMQEVDTLVATLAPKPTVVPLVGYPDEVILRYLERNPQELLVIGAFRDRGAGSATALGTIAHRLVEAAPTSVLMVKDQHTHLNKILAGADINDAVMLDVASHLAKTMAAQFDILHVAPSADDPVSEAALTKVTLGWTKQLESQGFSQKNLQIQCGNVAESILNLAHTGHYDLVVVGSQSGAGHFLGSVANQVVQFAEPSVLIVRTRT